jgi:paraquat-inducible protein A
MTLGGRRFLLACAVLAAGVLLALAVSLPFVRLTRPALLAHAHSLLSAVVALFDSGQLALAAVVLVFAVFLPLIKLLYLVLLATLPASELTRSATQLQALDWLGRWSPHDVLALALALVLLVGHETLAQRSAIGVYLLLAAIATMLLAYAWLRGEATARRMRAPALRAAYATAMRGLPFGVLLALAAATFAAGVTLPVVRLNERLAGTDLHSLASLVQALYTQGDAMLAAGLLLLAIVFPVMRLLHLLTLALSRVLPPSVRNKAVLSAEGLGRFATADTMVLALMLFALVASGDAQPAVQPGAWCYAASVLLTMLAYAWTNLIGPSAVRETSSLQARLAGLTAETARTS